MAEDRYNDTPVESIPEVADFEAVKQKYKAFRQANEPFFKYLDELQEQYNQKLEAANKAVRSRNASCSDFHLYNRIIKYNPEAMLTALGREDFLRLGGKETVQTVYSVDKTRAESAITASNIPKHVVDSFRSEEPRYHTPKKLVIL